MCFRLWPVFPPAQIERAHGRGHRVAARAYPLATTAQPLSMAILNTPPIGGASESSNSSNAIKTFVSHSTHRKNPASVSTIAGAIWQESQFLHWVHIGGPSHKDLGQSRPSKSQYPCKAARKRPQRGYRAAVRARLRRSRRSSHSTISPSMQWTVEQAEVERRIAAGEIVSAAEPWRPAQLK